MMTEAHAIESARRARARGRDESQVAAVEYLAGHRRRWLDAMWAGLPLTDEIEACRPHLLALSSVDPWTWHLRKHGADTCRILSGLDEVVVWGGTPEAALDWLEVLRVNARRQEHIAELELAMSLVDYGIAIDDGLDGWTPESDDSALDDLAWWAGWHRWAHGTAAEYATPDCGSPTPRGLPCGDCWDCTTFQQGKDFGGGPRLASGTSPLGPAMGPAPRHADDRIAIRRLGNEWLFLRLFHQTWRTP